MGLLGRARHDAVAAHGPWQRRLPPAATRQDLRLVLATGRRRTPPRATASTHASGFRPVAPPTPPSWPTVIVCMDAHSGRTLWEAVYRPNSIRSKPTAVTTIWRSPRASRRDRHRPRLLRRRGGGKKLWSQPVGGSHEAWKGFIERCIAHKMKAYKFDSEGVPEMPNTARRKPRLQHL